MYFVPMLIFSGPFLCDKDQILWTPSYFVFDSAMIGRWKLLDPLGMEEVAKIEVVAIAGGTLLNA